MMKTLLLIVLTVIALSATPYAETCNRPKPAGAVVTPDCNYIVEQVDPGVWRDSWNRIWVWLSGVAVTVKLEDLMIGRK